MSEIDRWRFVDVGAMTAHQTMARGPVLGEAISKGGDPIVLTSVWGETHVNVGWFDDIDATLDVEACRALGVSVVRRPIFGGGTAFYQEGCTAMWAFNLDKDKHGDLDAELSRYQPLFAEVLRRIGLGEVRYEGSSDLRWRDRKLGALIAQDAGTCTMIGGFINLTRPDVELYLKVARIPDEKFRDKVIKDMREYVVTAADIAGHPVTYEDLVNALREVLTESGAELYDQPMSEAELSGMQGYIDWFASDDLIFRVSSSRFTAAAPEGSRTGFGNHKGRKLCRAGVALDADGVVVAAMLAGDMHVGPADVIDRTAAALVGAHSADADDLRARIAAVFEADDVQQADEILGVTTDDLLIAVKKAVANA
ncbi:lipoyl protein ligase domain-containing protein [Actinocorallia sp. A-T 12471]|uniref:lipoate--protein ligase family protein n=1 Tax=Actinocorallia sp. A-T 12471 TaxID=3089813 RepID=UPI0029CB1EDB|nr:hypothetical protein [Actinocorallia sp. A-T 12471]MDX6741471.1 hypothetical protein [Actinocorallia sp. A-T 12471]